MLEESQSVEYFEFIGGRLCLDFINTLSDRFKATPVEVLLTYDDWLLWCQQAGLLDEEQTCQLSREAKRPPELAARWLREIKQARAVLTQIVSDVANGQPSRAADVARFNGLLSATLVHLSLTSSERGFAWDWNRSAQESEMRPLWSIVRDAADLLTSSELGHVHICVSDDCDWLFLDTSKNHSRRWCDMKVCGNRAKARRYYGRQKSIK